MIDNSDIIRIVTTGDESRVLSNDLPDWAESDGTGQEDETAASTSSDGWLEAALTGVGTRPAETPESAETTTDESETSNLKLTVRRTVCQNCGEGTIRRIHKGCAAPIISIDGTWRCGDCGVKAPPSGRCPDCGGTHREERVNIPLALELDLRPVEIERAIHEATNDRRTSHGLDPLSYSDPLSAIALQHSRDMAQRGYFSHSSPEGEEAIDRYQTYGHQARKCGENLAKVSPPRTASLSNAAREVVDAWMNSPGHRKNLLRPSFEREGIGVYLSRDGAVYATQNFE